jgi:hypothetical protein
MTKRTRPKAEILEYKQLKTAAGGSGASGGGGSGFHVGENLICKILYAEHAEPGGYSVLVPKHNVEGFLPTVQRFIPGEEVPVQSVCMSNGRMLFQCRYGARITSD